jgi:two-component system, NtrC family, response regulator AtoC
MANNGRTILVGEDELEVRSYLEMALRCHGYAIESAQDGEEVLACLDRERDRISLVLLDIMMPRKDGLETLRDIRRLDRDLPIIMLSGASSPLKVVEAMKSGATDFIPKPVSHEDLCEAIEKAVGAAAPFNGYAVPEVQSPSPANMVAMRIRAVEPILKQIGASEVPVLIQGETGVGKEIVARQLCAQSPRSNRVFLKLNCAALPSELVESELFGYERGAFTGAHQRKIGLLEKADGGTLFLDEIGDLDLSMQAKLLRVLQERSFRRLGGTDDILVDFRLMTATNRDLKKEVTRGTFREDLYFRLNVVSFELPPLRTRVEDILPLSIQAIVRFGKEFGKEVLDIEPEAKALLERYSYPGNIRELQNIIERAMILCHGKTLTVNCLPRELREASPQIAVAVTQGDQPIVRVDMQLGKQSLAEMESAIIEEVVRLSGHNKSLAAKYLGLTRFALDRRLKKIADA